MAKCHRLVDHDLRQTAQAVFPFSSYDVLISGQALARDMILVTHNTNEFARVTDLRIEDWEA